MPKRQDRILQDKSHDPTKPDRKISDPAVCPDCGATYIDGRWTWRHGPVEAQRALCSACRRTRDEYPAGFVTVNGAFATTHRDEVIRIARHTEDREKQTHPINRIMSISEEDEQLVFLTTEIHLAQAIGKSLRSALKGHLDITFAEDIVRVTWTRDE